MYHSMVAQFRATTPFHLMHALGAFGIHKRALKRVLHLVHNDFASCTAGDSPLCHFMSVPWGVVFCNLLFCPPCSSVLQRKGVAPSPFPFIGSFFLGGGGQLIHVVICGKWHGGMREGVLAWRHKDILDLHAVWDMESVHVESVGCGQYSFFCLKTSENVCVCVSVAFM